MKIVTTFHPTSSVIASLKCCLSSDAELEHLVVARPNHIEVFSLTPDGLHPECGLDIWGRALALKPVPTQTKTDLLVLTDHPDPHAIVLSYHPNSGSSYLSTKSSLSLYDRNASHAEFCNDVVLSADGEVAVVSCYKGKLRIISLDNGSIVESFDVAIPELNLLSLTLLDYADQYHVAIAHVDTQRRIQMLSRELDISEKEISATPSELLPSTALLQSAFPLLDAPLHLVNVAPFQIQINEEAVDTEGGIMVIGGRQIFYFELVPGHHQRVKTEKKRRLEKRKSSSTDEQKMKAKEKEKERESRKVKPQASVKWPWSEVTAVCSVDSSFRKLLIGDKFGRLSLLSLDTRPSLTLAPLGEISPPMTLTYLNSQIAYVGSHFGDSQLIRILPAPEFASEADTLPIPADITTTTPSALSHSDKGKETMSNDDRNRAKGSILKSKGSYVKTLDTYRNIAPIADAVLTDVSGQAQIVTCSGERSTGSLSILQNGADFVQQANMTGISEITRIWPFRSQYDSSVHTHVLLSTPRDSHVFYFDDRTSFQHLEASSTGFITTDTTLALSNIARRTRINGKSSYINSSWVVQVTPKAVALLEYDETLRVYHRVGNGWSPARLGRPTSDREIIAADISPSQVVLGLTGGLVVALNTDDQGQFNVVQSNTFGDDNRKPKEISAISCQPFDTTKFFTSYIAVSFWSDQTVSIYTFSGDKLQLVSESTPLPSLPRSLLLYNFGPGRKTKDPDYRPVLLAGLTDGSIVSFNFRENQLQDKKVLSLGTSPIDLSPCDVDGKRAVFAGGSISAILYWDRQRIRHSTVSLKDVVTATYFNSRYFPSSQIFATESSIIVGKVRGVDKMQIRQVPLGYDNPRRIAYHPTFNEYGVACRTVTPSRVGEAESFRSTFNIYDGHSFQRLSQFEADQEEEISSVCSLTKLDTSNSIFATQQPAFCIGTLYYRYGEREPSSGRLIVFHEPNPGAPPSEGKRLGILAQVETEGCVWALDVVNDMIVAAINSSVVLYNLAKHQEIQPPVISLEKLHEWNHNYVVINLVAYGDIVTIGDAINSVSVLQVTGQEIKSIAKDYGALYPVAVESLPSKGVIGADASGNLFTFAMEQIEQRALLSRNGSYHLGDMITKVLPGGMVAAETQDAGMFKPEHLFFTSSGRIYQTLHVNDESVSLALTALQHNLAKKIVGPGGIRHTKWRTPSNWRGRSDADAAVGFLDGDFLEQFLTYPDADTLLEGENEAERVSIGPSGIRDLLEKLQSLH